MAEGQDKDSKTEAATEKKLRDSIEKGQVPVSREAPLLASFAAILVFTMFFAYDRAVELGGFLRTFIEKPDDWALERGEDATALSELVVMEVARALIVLLVLLIVAGVTASILQNPPAFVLDRIAPKFSRISLRHGWQRIFGLQGFVEFLKQFGKVALTSAILVFIFRHAHMLLIDGMVTSPVSIGETIRGVVIQMLICIVLVMTVIGVADIVWSRFKWLRDLMMTRQEVKDELKQAEGDPIVKQRLRSLARDRTRRRMMQAVPGATLVIANPTHFAIALRYVQNVDTAPVVVAKGQDLIALKIREIAEANGVPVFENVDLARSMYKQVSVDSVIPPHFYQAVAELVKIVYAKSNKASGRNGQA